MVLQARVRMRREGSYVEVVDHGARFVHVSGDHESCLAVLKADGYDQIDEILDRCSHFIDPEEDVIDRSPEHLVTRCRCPQYGSAETIREAGCTIRWPIIVHGGFSHYHVLAPNRDAFRAAVKNLREIGVLEIDLIEEVPGDVLDISLPLSSVTQRMSRKQLRALRLAIEDGYYETPRETSTAQLAEQMALARTTYQEHLRKAERTVMRHLGALLVQHPILAASAQKGPGRPPREQDVEDLVSPGGVSSP